MWNPSEIWILPNVSRFIFLWRQCHQIVQNGSYNSNKIVVFVFRSISYLGLGRPIAKIVSFLCKPWFYCKHLINLIFNFLPVHIWKYPSWTCLWLIKTLSTTVCNPIVFMNHPSVNCMWAWEEIIELNYHP